MEEHLHQPPKGTFEHDMYSRMQKPQEIQYDIIVVPETFEEDMAMRFPAIEKNTIPTTEEATVHETPDPPKPPDPYSFDMAMRFPATEKGHGSSGHEVHRTLEAVAPVLTPEVFEEETGRVPASIVVLHPIESTPSIENGTAVTRVAGSSRTLEQQAAYLQARARLAKRLGLKGEEVDRLGPGSFPHDSEMMAEDGVESTIEPIVEEDPTVEVPELTTTLSSEVLAATKDTDPIPGKKKFLGRLKRSTKTKETRPESPRSKKSVETTLKKPVKSSGGKHLKSPLKKVREFDGDNAKKIIEFKRRTNKIKDPLQQQRELAKGPFPIEKNQRASGLPRSLKRPKEAMKRRGARMLVATVDAKRLLNSQFWIDYEEKYRFIPGSQYVWPRRIANGVIKYNKLKNSRATRRVS